MDSDTIAKLSSTLAGTRRKRWESRLLALVRQAYDGDEGDLAELSEWVPDNHPPEAKDIAGQREAERIVEQAAEIVRVTSVLVKRRLALERGVDGRRPVVSRRVRNFGSLGRSPPPPNGDGKSRKLSRSEKHRLEQEAAAQARHARQQARAAQSGQPAPPFDTFVKIGRVVRFNSRDMSGFAAVTLPVEGYVELPFSGNAARTAGVTTLHPTQEIQLTIKRRINDGALLVEKIELSAGARAAAIAEAERQCEAAERNYALFGRAPRI
jgi:hypothetical protein